MRLVSTAFGRVQIERRGQRSELETQPPTDGVPTLAAPGPAAAILAPGMPQRPLFEAVPSQEAPPAQQTPQP